MAGNSEPEHGPRLPSVDLAVWIGSNVEPCPRCGSYHEDRRKWVCNSCNRITCIGVLKRLSDGTYWHIVGDEEDKPIECGVEDAVPTDDLWPQHRARLEDLLHELEGWSSETPPEEG